MSLISGLVLSTISSAASAHHSRAEFTGNVIELEGELIAVEWINPHPHLILRLSDRSADVWEVQLYGSATSLDRAGIDASFFPVGEKITVAGLASRRKDKFLLGSHALLPRGLETVFQYNTGPHWSGGYIGGSGGETIDESALARAASEDRGMFRVWSVPSTEDAIAAMMASMPRMSSAGLAARERWDDVDNPVTRCEEPWLPFAMMTPASREFIDDGDSIILRVEYLAGGTRTIHLSQPADVDAETPGRMGRSFGRWEGNTLVVETDQIGAPAFDPFGSLQSSEMMFTERFVLSDDQSRLDYELVMNDPVAFEEPATFRLQYLALGEDFLSQCEAP